MKTTALFDEGFQFRGHCAVLAILFCHLVHALILTAVQVESDLKKTRHNKDKLERKRSEDDQKGSEGTRARVVVGLVHRRAARRYV